LAVAETSDCGTPLADLFAKKQREKTKSKIEITYS